MRISKEAKEHIQNHLEYPATKEEIMAQCGNMADVAEEEKAVVAKLPDREFRSAKEVLSVIAKTS